MLTRTGLQAVAEELADIGAELGQDEEETVELAHRVMDGLRRRGGIVTPNYDRGRFGAAVRAAYHG